MPVSLSIFIRDDDDYDDTPSGEVSQIFCDVHENRGFGCRLDGLDGILLRKLVLIEHLAVLIIKLYSFSVTPGGSPPYQHLRQIPSRDTSPYHFIQTVVCNSAASTFSGNYFDKYKFTENKYDKYIFAKYC